MFFAVDRNDRERAGVGDRKRTEPEWRFGFPKHFRPVIAPSQLGARFGRFPVAVGTAVLGPICGEARIGDEQGGGQTKREAERSVWISLLGC